MRAQISPPSSVTSLITRILSSQRMENVYLHLQYFGYINYLTCLCFLSHALPPMALFHAMATRKGHIFFIATAQMCDFPIDVPMQ
jgi:hypothetical protein